MNIAELSPRYDSRASFYHKAKIITNEHGDLILSSYDTEVAVIADDKAQIKDWYSNTTGRHIKEFLLQNGFKAINKKQMLKDYKVGGNHVDI